MNKKFTAIYRDSWIVGSHQVTNIKFRRFEQMEGETMLDACIREEIADSVEYVFVGHPELEGEEDYRLTFI